MVTILKRFDLFLFDFDGLLVDTERLHFQAYKLLCALYGIELGWDFERYVSYAHFAPYAVRDALYDAFPQLYVEQPNWDLLYQEKKKIYLELIKGGSLQLMPGVEKVLCVLEQADKKRCVVTHSPRQQVEEIKDRLPVLKTIPHWITREDYKEPKPAPDGYLEALRRLAHPGDRLVGFEDTVRGFKALQAAHINAYLITPLPQNIPHFLSFDQVFDFH